MKKLLFVYNADSGKLSALGHSLHKLISPQTYDCSLCKVTHGFFGAKQEWTEFIDELDYAVQFYHKDEFLVDYPDSSVEDFPVLIQQCENNFTELLSRQEMKELSSLERLIECIREKLGIRENDSPR